MRYRYLSILLIYIFLHQQGHAQPELKFEENQTLTWQETIEFYQYLDNKYEDAYLMEAGSTDSGKPLHLFIISRDNLITATQAKTSRKTIILVNNGIHPGEPCGVDASVLFAWEILENPDKYKEILDNSIIAIVPILNVGGALNRSEFHRANQNGPIEHGFRGNSINMDLNRDFIKLDTRNAQSMVKIIREWDPDVFIDTHTSNGSDYPYVITLIATQKDKLNAPLSDFLYEEMLPELYERMEAGPYEMTPYVMNRDYRNPENGIVAFMDHPRYTTGYASLFNVLGFTTEAHMFKPFRDRVLATYHFIMNVSQYASENSEKIQILRSLAKEQMIDKNEFTISWELDTTSYDPLQFKGYKMETGVSSLTGQANYSYNRDSTWNKVIPFYTSYKPVKTILAPDIYIVPAAWEQVVKRLEINEVEFTRLRKDTSIFVEYYYIDDFSSYNAPYNGHYKHFNTRVRKVTGKLRFLKGDLLIPLKQDTREYLIQTLEPEGEDSFFNWNFFDSILSRKEYFSPYVFEEIAKDLLAKDPVLAEEYRLRKEKETDFANDHYAQLRFIYERSPWSESTYKRYPVVRLFLEN
ncbi:MAG: M14 family metallopeptidase [Bacteroidales bacterium]